MSQFLTDINKTEFTDLGTAERKEREKRNRENQILDAAEEVFAEKGFRNTTIDDIAERAELSKGTIYLYFKSKELIYTGISLRATTILGERFREVMERETTGLAKIRAVGKAYYQYCFEFPSYFKIMMYIENLDHKKLGHEGDPLVKRANEDEWTNQSTPPPG